jgi:hypothetical protein
VRQAGLVAGVDEAVVGRPAVALKHTGVILAEDHRGVPVATAAGDAVDGDLLADEGPQPRPDPADPPAGLIGGDHRTGPHASGQGLVGRLQGPGGARDRLDDPTGVMRTPS